MLRFTPSYFYLSLSLISLVSATPFPYPRDIPADASYLALDSRSGHLIAFRASGENLGTFSVPRVNSTRSTLTKRGGPGSCTELKIEDAKKLPGWSKLEAQAKQNWGGGHYNLVLNPEEYKDRPATVCISTDTAVVKMSGQPNCHTQKQSTEGKITGTSGTVALDSQQGSHLTQHTSVTQEASIAAGMSVTAEVGIPDVAKVSTSMSTTVTLSNTLTKGFDSTADTMQTQSISINAPEGSHCRLDFASNSCDYSGSGTIRFYATGWVWFNYDDKTKDHYKWALKIDDVLQDINDRSSTMNFAVSGNIVTKADYKGTCDGGASITSKPKPKSKSKSKSKSK